MTGETSERTNPCGSMRRKDRAADDVWIIDFLTRSAMGVLASVRDGQPLQTPNTFVFDETRRAIYVHTAATGHMRSTIETHDRVSFCVAEMGRLLPADVALEFSVEYASVVAFGRCVVVTEELEAKQALQRLLDKYFPHLKPQRDYRPTTEQELSRTAVFRVDIEHWTGKCKTEVDSFPGAFEYGTPPT